MCAADPDLDSEPEPEPEPDPESFAAHPESSGLSPRKAIVSKGPASSQPGKVAEAESIAPGTRKLVGVE